MSLSVQNQYAKAKKDNLRPSAKWKSFFVEAVILLMILLFAYTGLSKWEDQPHFRGVLAGSPLIDRHANLVSWFVIVSELLIVMLLLIQPTRRIGLLGSFTMMLLFTIYIAYMMLFTPHRPCSCGGIIQKMTWGQHLIFNAITTIFIFFALRFGKGKRNAPVP